MRILKIDVNVSFICLIICLSCTNSNSERTLDSSSSKESKKITSSLDTELHNRKATYLEQLDITRIEKAEKEKEEMKKIGGENYKPGNEIEIIESKILFKSNFKPYAILKLKNNLKISLIAFEIVITPKPNESNKCSGTIIKKNTIIKPNQTITIKENLEEETNDCKMDEASIKLGDCIFSNGKKIDMSDIFRTIKGLGE